MIVAAIEWDKIGELLWAAPAAAIGVSIAFSLFVLGVARAGDARRDGASVTAAAYGALALVAAGACAGAVVFGINIIVSK